MTDAEHDAACLFDGGRSGHARPGALVLDKPTAFWARFFAQPVKPVGNATSDASPPVPACPPSWSRAKASLWAGAGAWWQPPAGSARLTPSAGHHAARQGLPAVVRAGGPAGADEVRITGRATRDDAAAILQKIARSTECVARWPAWSARHAKHPLALVAAVAVKALPSPFLATHAPLLALIALVVLRPDWLSPVSVLLAALGATLAQQFWSLLRSRRACFARCAGGRRPAQFQTVLGQPLRLSAGARTRWVAWCAWWRCWRWPIGPAACAVTYKRGALVLQPGPWCSGPTGQASRCWQETRSMASVDQSANIPECRTSQIAMNRTLATVVHKGEKLCCPGSGLLPLALDVPTTDADGLAGGGSAADFRQGDPR